MDNIPEIHSVLNKKELEYIKPFTDKLYPKPTVQIMPQIFEWVKTGVINKRQFVLLIQYHCGIIDYARG